MKKNTQSLFEDTFWKLYLKAEIAFLLMSHSYIPEFSFMVTFSYQRGRDVETLLQQVYFQNRYWGTQSSYSHIVSVGVSFNLV